MKILVSLFSLIFIVPTIALSDDTSSTEVFSKPDAAAMFGMNLKEWKVNVVDASQSGVASYDTDGDLKYTMRFPAPNGFVTVTPSYSENNQRRPWKLSVGVLFQSGSNIGFLAMNDEELKSFIEAIYREMLPEYIVFSNFIFSNDQVIQTAEMFEVGYDDIVGELGKKYLGCFQDCIQRQSSTD